MAIDDVIKGIYDKGNLEIESIRKNTDDQVSKILAKAEEDAKRIVEEGRASILKELEREKMRKISAVNVELKRQYMDSLNNIINSYVKAVEDSLRKMRNTDLYRNYIARSIEMGLKEINVSQENAIIYISEKDRDLVKDYRNVKFAPPLDDLGGVIVSTMDGKIVSDRSLRNLVEEKGMEIKEKIYEKIKEEL